MASVFFKLIVKPTWLLNKLSQSVVFGGAAECGTIGRRPIHMSSVNRAGSVCEISPRHSFLCKNIDVFTGGTGLARLPRDLGNRDENFPI